MPFPAPHSAGAAAPAGGGASTVGGPAGGSRPWWARPALYGGAGLLVLVVLAASETVRYSAFAGAAMVFRPATVLPFLATVLLVAGARRAAGFPPAAGSAPEAASPPVRTVRTGVIAGLGAAGVLVTILKVVETIRPELDEYTVRSRFDHGSWIVSVIGVAAIVLGLVLVLLRGLPDPDAAGRWRAVAYGVAYGVVPGASAYTAIWWTWFGDRGDGRDTPTFLILSALPQWREAPTAGMVLGLAAGWVVAMVAAAFGGRALGEAVPPPARPVLHRAGAVTLAAAGAVLVYFMQVERGFMMDRTSTPDDPTLMRSATRLWANTVGDVHPGMLTFLLLGAGAAAAALVVVRSRSGGSQPLR
ncbi:hypothetical protein GCM10009557_94410 [Virgisporangium ochraceum]